MARLSVPDHMDSGVPATGGHTPLSIEEVNALSDGQFVEYFRGIYEHAPWIMARTAEERPFTNRTELYLASAVIIDRAGEEEQLALLKAHPELARPDLNEGTLTEESTREQHRAGLEDLDPSVKRKLNTLAQEYTDRYGFPGIVCVREHADTESIIAELERRIGRSPQIELTTTLAEVKKIGWGRIRDRVAEGPGHEGYLTTHALDTANGTAAAGLGYDVTLLRKGHAAPIFSGYTNSDGRSEGAIVAGADFIAGVYEITFRVGDYFAGKESNTSRQYLQDVPLRVTIDTPTEHYHVPLIVSHWGYTTYRGS